MEHTCKLWRQINCHLFQSFIVFSLKTESSEQKSPLVPLSCEQGIIFLSIAKGLLLNGA